MNIVELICLMIVLIVVFLIAIDKTRECQALRTENNMLKEQIINIKYYEKDFL